MTNPNKNNIITKYIYCEYFNVDFIIRDPNKE